MSVVTEPLQKQSHCFLGTVSVEPKLPSTKTITLFLGTFGATGRATDDTDALGAAATGLVLEWIVDA